MALTVIHSPTKYDFSRNSNYIEIETDNAYTTINKGDKANCYFANLFNAVLDDTLTIIWGATTLTYTFKAVANISLGHLALPGVGQTSQEFASDVAITLFTDTALSTDFNISSYQSSVHIEAKLPGPGFNLNTSSSTVTGVGFYAAAGTDNIVPDSPRPNYQIVIELQVYQNAAWETITIIGKESANNKVRADLAKYIDAYLDYDLPNFLDMGQSFKCTKSIKKFRVKVSEVYGNPAIEVSTTLSGMGAVTMDGLKHVSDEYKVLKAGFDTISGRLKKDTQFDYYADNNIFLTRQPRVKYASSKRTQAEFLYFMFSVIPATTAKLALRFYDKKNALAFSTDVAATTGTIELNDVWCFPLNVAFNVYPEYAKLEAFILNTTSGLPLSETFTFYADEAPSLDETFLFFTNSDSGTDTIRCYGINECKIEFEREIAERTLTIDDTNNDGDVVQTYVQKTNTFSVFSGWRTQQELNYIEELFLSKKVLLFSNIYGQEIQIPVIITSKELVRNRSNQNLKGFVIEYREAISSEISQANHIPITA